MLTWPKARKSNHPLADEEDAKEVFAQLSCIDSLSALQRLSELLDGLKIARGIGLGRLYDIVDGADRTGRSHYRSASQEFLGHRHRLTRYQGNRIWTSAGEYVTQLAEAYQWCLAQFLAGASGAADLRPHVVRIIGRAIRLQAAALKWDYFCYTAHFGKWAEIYRLHSLAEARGRAQEKVLLYRGGRLSTLESEFMQALLLAAASPQALLPEQIDAAERIIAWFGGHFALSNPERAKQPYFFDPASGARPGPRADRDSPTTYGATLRGGRGRERSFGSFCVGRRRARSVAVSSDCKGCQTICWKRPSGISSDTGMSYPRTDCMCASDGPTALLSFMGLRKSWPMLATCSSSIP